MKRTTIASAINKAEINSGIASIIGAVLEVKDPNTGLVIETVRVVKNSEDLVIAGNLYTAMQFDFKLKESDSEPPQLNVTLFDPYQVFNDILERTRGLAGASARLFIVNADELDVEPLSYRFDVKTASAKSDDYTVSIVLGTENPLTVPFPARRQTKLRCQWRYKSPECGYTGALPKCDLSLNGENGCREHENEMNFGGFPTIQALNI